MSDAEIIHGLQQDLGPKALEVTNPDRRRIFLRVAPGDLADAATLLRDRYGAAHLSTVSGVDKGEAFEILYHFASPAAVINVRTDVPKASPHVATICPVIPGAIFYERELQDMFGLVIDGIPDPRPLITPDDWPPGNYPLRKDWKHERPEERIPGGKP
jgi:membrane-bound hydrogenase subunit beta